MIFKNSHSAFGPLIRLSYQDEDEDASNTPDMGSTWLFALFTDTRYEKCITYGRTVPELESACS